jgi:predicted dehydrogenase
MTLNHILVCGLGSIGQRHVNSFRKLGVSRVDAFTTGRGTLGMNPTLALDSVFKDLDEALRARPGAVIVTNPTALHLEVAKAAINAGAHVLIEKPISNTLRGCRQLLKKAKNKGGAVAIGCNLRFHPLLARLKRIVRTGDLGNAIVAQAHFGSWLPDWHPWEDYHMSYAARKDLGGGAALTHIHEIDYLIWLFGNPMDVKGLCSQMHILKTSIDEASLGLIRHDSGVISSVGLSLCQMPQRRHLHVGFERGTVEVDFIQGILWISDRNGRQEESRIPNESSWDETYLEQARAFMALTEKDELSQLCSGDEALTDLRVALCIKGELKWMTRYSR